MPRLNFDKSQLRAMEQCGASDEQVAMLIDDLFEMHAEIEILNDRIDELTDQNVSMSWRLNPESMGR